MAKKRSTKRPTKKSPRKPKVLIPTAPWPEPISLVIHGLPGVGKTEFASHFPNPLFVIDPHETGIVDLVAYNRTKAPFDILEIDTFNRLLLLGDKVSTYYQEGVRTIVLDSMTGMENLCFRAHCQKHFGGDWSKEGFFSYQQGPKNAAKTDWLEFLDMLELFMVEGISVILIAHTESKPYSNPTGMDHDRYTPFMDKATWQQIHRWGRAVIYYGYNYEVIKKGVKGKATGSVQRQLYTEWSPAYDAKNRYGLDAVIEAGDSGKEAYDNFCKVFPTP